MFVFGQFGPLKIISECILGVFVRSCCGRGGAALKIHLAVDLGPFIRANGLSVVANAYPFLRMSGLDAVLEEGIGGQTIARIHEPISGHVTAQYTAHFIFEVAGAGGVEVIAANAHRIGTLGDFDEAEGIVFGVGDCVTDEGKVEGSSIGFGVDGITLNGLEVVIVDGDAVPMVESHRFVAQDSEIVVAEGGSCYGDIDGLSFHIFQPKNIKNRITLVLFS